MNLLLAFAQAGDVNNWEMSLTSLKQGKLARRLVNPYGVRENRNLERVAAV